MALALGRARILGGSLRSTKSRGCFFDTACVLVFWGACFLSCAKVILRKGGRHFS